jgi:hypothetical protein
MDSQSIGWMDVWMQMVKNDAILIQKVLTKPIKVLELVMTRFFQM